eukprot:9303390-Heterocapsa_arctica.AAC.1
MVTCDHVILREPDEGLDGQRAGLQVADLGTDSLAFYPMVHKTYGACTQAMRDFCGSEVLHQLSSDNAPELVRTA